MRKKIPLLLIFCLLIGSSLNALERRREQFPTDFGYLVMPIPFKIPGSEPGFGFMGGFNNIPLATPTTIDAYLVGISGGVTGLISVVSDIPLWPETLLLDLSRASISKGAQKSYRDRSMDSDPQDFLITEFSDSSFAGGRLILTLFDRMFEIFSIQYDINANISAIRDNEENLLYEKKQSFKGKLRSTGSQIDWTDDRIDPRHGLRLVYTYSDSPALSTDSPDYYVEDYNLTGYIPMFSKSTVALNWFRSGATVRRQGNTDLDYLIAKETVTCLANCDSATIASLAKNQQAHNRYGSAASLGGASRLRSYAGGRYSGAQVEFRGAEFRWNITDEKTPFDLYFIKDIRTGLQLAFFYEEGTVADVAEKLWNEKRTSLGAGARLVTSSGFVYRLDIASGQEGREVILFFDYPWGTIGQ